MLISPDIRELIQGFTKTAESIERMAVYGGVRGIGFTSFTAFSFSVLLGLLGLFMNYYFAEFHKEEKLALKLLIYLLAFVAAISAGRTAAAGFILGLLCYFCSYSFKLYVSAFFRVTWIALLLLFVVAFYILSDPELFKVANKYYNYAFRFIYVYATEGRFSNSSLSNLDSMYFSLTESQLLFGDGKYTGADGAYYMHTDPGFMRFGLMFGLIPTLVIYIGFLAISFVYYNVNKHQLSNIGMLIILVVLMSFIFHYKGELIMFNVSYMKLYYFVFISCSILTLIRDESHAKNNN